MSTVKLGFIFMIALIVAKVFFYLIYLKKILQSDTSGAKIWSMYAEFGRMVCMCDTFFVCLIFLILNQFKFWIAQMDVLVDQLGNPIIAMVESINIAAMTLKSTREIRKLHEWMYPHHFSEWVLAKLQNFLEENKYAAKINTLILFDL